MPPPLDILLTHGNLELRCWQHDDEEDLFAAARESAGSVGRWLAWCHAGYTREHAQAWIAHCRDGWQAQNHYAFAIRKSATGELLGGVGLSRINRLGRSGNLGYWVRSTRQRQGSMRTAARLVVEFGFDRLGLTRIEILVALENLASRRIAESLGALQETTRTNRLRTGSGVADAAVYSLAPENLGGRFSAS